MNLQIANNILNHYDIKVCVLNNSLGDKRVSR